MPKRAALFFVALLISCKRADPPVVGTSALPPATTAAAATSATTATTGTSPSTQTTTKTPVSAKIRR